MATSRNVKIPREMNDGARALIASGLTATAIGKIAHVSRQAAQKWLDCRGIPGDDSQLLLEAAGLATRAQWTGAPQPPPTVASPAAPTRPKCPGPRTPVQRLEDALAEYDQLLAGDVPLGARARFMTARDAATERLGRLQGETLTEAKILKSPAFRRILRTIQAAVAPWPEVVRAIAVAMQQLAGEERGE